jgi:hypothetical protein
MEVPRITPDEARRRMEAGESVYWLDARNDEDYGKDSEQIPGARRMRTDDVETNWRDLPDDGTFISYCT